MAFDGLTGGTGFAVAPTLHDPFAEDKQYQYFMENLRGKTPDQVRNFVANNVTDLASARTLLTLMLLWMTYRS